ARCRGMAPDVRARRRRAAPAPRADGADCHGPPHGRAAPHAPPLLRPPRVRSRFPCSLATPDPANSAQTSTVDTANGQGPPLGPARVLWAIRGFYAFFHGTAVRTLYVGPGSDTGAQPSQSLKRARGRRPKRGQGAISG